jgi:opacity protein-like surface antigen
MRKLIIPMLLVCAQGFAADNIVNESVYKKQPKVTTIHKPVHRKKVFVHIQSGHAWMRKANIACATVANGWDLAKEGYNAKLSNTAFWDFALGIRPWSFLDAGVSYGVYQTMHYEKYQTGEDVKTIGFTSDRRMRFFDLDHKNVMFNVALHPAEDKLTLNVDTVRIFPFVGGGIGVGLHQLNKFYTVGYAGIKSEEEGALDTFGVGSTTTIGQRRNSNSFAWQVNAGLTCASADNSVAFDLGYRYYDGGKFKTATQFMANTPDYQGSFVKPKSGWRGHVRSHQIVITFRYSF